MAQGLMNRREMPADHGMLFVYQKPQQASMWMKNTFLSLDMLFIDEKGRIVQIIPSTTPLSEDNISSKIPVKAVLELLAGTCHKKRIAVGDIVRHEIFATNQ